MPRRSSTPLWLPDGHLYLQVSDTGYPSLTARRPTVSGQATTSVVAFSTTTEARLPWRPKATGFVAILPDCLFGSHGCLPRTIASPTNLTVSQRGASLTFSWELPQGALVSTVTRLEVGTAEGVTNLASFDLPPAKRHSRPRRLLAAISSASERSRAAQ